ncbi:MAG TPA: leucine-rich repeat domain-containing protein [Mycobacterium sp.]|jgi:hypothetical protein|nr:leucine-rich repeat domain-containing protein [Mycobacterium sp.]
MPLRSLGLETRRHATVLLADLAAVADVIEEIDIDSAVLSVDSDRLDFPALHYLTLENCRVPDLAFLTGAAALRRLSLENCAAVASLSDLASMPNLETLIINGNTRIVGGDLQVLFRMPALRQSSVCAGQQVAVESPNDAADGTLSNHTLMLMKLCVHTVLGSSARRSGTGADHRP